MRPRPLLFTDVDGTVLDRAGRYAMTAEALAPMLPRLSIVLASSRTVLELSRNQRDLGIEGAVIAENGAVVALPWCNTLASQGMREEIDGRMWCVLTLGAPATVIRGAVQRAAARAGTAYIDQADVQPALGRRASVLLQPPAGHDASTLVALADDLRASGHSVASGGDWLAVTAGADKGRGMRVVLSLLAPDGSSPAVTAAAGDGDNDVTLLLAADRRFAIARDDGTWDPALRAVPGVEYVSPPGIAGWRDVVVRLAELEER